MAKENDDPLREPQTPRCKPGWAQKCAWVATIAMTHCSSRDAPYDAFDEDSGGADESRRDASRSAGESWRDSADDESWPSEVASEPEAGSGNSACARSAPVLLNGVLNARDLGGVPVQDHGSLACAALYRGGPLTLTDEGCLQYARLGIRTVVDLRIAGERASAPDAPCASAISTTVWAPMPIPYGVSPAEYIADLDARDSMAEIFRVAADEAAYPMYVHCTWGRDRTGVAAAVILLALGATRADVLAEYLLSQASVGAYPVSLNAVLDEIEQRGGIEGYLSSMGVSSEQVGALRARMIKR